jgi:2-polyprenyl-3-methyl-5-hydroxy-6-metoxy-1,4-benzoquinol methylase
MRQHTICPSCAFEKCKPLKGFERHHLLKCAHCRLVFSKYVPDDNQLQEHYMQYKRNDYRSPITTSRYRELLDAFEPYRSTSKLLDVGCGIGYFLEEAIGKKWKVSGTELTNEAVEICRKKGIEMHKGDLKDIELAQAGFDVVTSFEVVEHLTNPAEHIKKISLLLRKGGLLYMTTPNFDSINRRLLKDKWNVIEYPEHLCYFNKTSLHHLLIENGFEKIKLRTEGISLGRLLKSQQEERMDFSSAHNSDERIRKSMERNGLLKSFKSLVNYKLNVTSMGESLKAWYIKS